jgi:hypothetical protein
MLEGLYKTNIIDAKDIEDELARLCYLGRGREALNLLKPRDVVQTCSGHNQIYAITAGELLARCTGASRITDDFYKTDSWPTFTGFFMGYIAMSARDATPAYSDNYTEGTFFDCSSQGAGTPSWWLGAGAHKHLSSEIETHTCYSEALSSGRRSIYRTMKYLWLPSDFSSSNIRSAEWWTPSNWNTAYRNHNSASTWRSAGRIRFKDSCGNNITLNKTSNQALLFEYTIRFTTL